MPDSLAMTNPAGNPGDADQIWWWQVPRNAPLAAVRMVCGRNALSAVARASSWQHVRLAVVDVLSVYALAVPAEDKPRSRHRHGTRIQALLDWAQIHPSHEVQNAVSILWREVLAQHRAEWEAEMQRLLDRWRNPIWPLRDRRRRGEGGSG